MSILFFYSLLRIGGTSEQWDSDVALGVVLYVVLVGSLSSSTRPAPGRLYIVSRNQFRHFVVA